MLSTSKSLLVLLTLLLLSFSPQVLAQSTTGSISGNVTDEQQAAIPNATVTARNTETSTTRTAQTDSEGRYNFVNLPVGPYEVTVEAGNFARYVQTGITLLLNQNAIIDVTMRPASVQETVTVTENASLLNTTSAEVSTRFDSRRLSELPLATNRNVFNVALSAPGVSQLGSGQTGFAAGVSYSANGGRLRSNNFQVDGQDTNDPSVSGGQQSINNPDIVQEVRLITNQFLPEYGRNAGSVLNIITKAGTNEYHGSLFWFHNSNVLNARSNLDKAAGFTEAPFRIENQIGGTIGGPVLLPRFGEGGPATISGRDRTFFFASFQRWSDRQLGSGSTISGVPTAEGRQVLQAAAGTLPQVQALLRFLPAAQTPLGRSVSFTRGGQTFTVPVGSLTGATSVTLDDYQISGRIDHNFSDANRFTARYLYDDTDLAGSGQATPPGLTNVNPSRAQALNLSLASVLSPRLVNEARLAYSRFATITNAADPTSQEIPSIEINELGLVGFNAAPSRTAIGLGVNLPQFRTNNTYQVQDNLSFTTGNHAFKFGGDVRRTQVKSFFVPTIRGRLAYSTLQRFVDDNADVGTSVNRPLPGGQEIQYYNYYDVFTFFQDEWRIRPNFTLTYGLRYELPGNSFADLVPVNEGIVAAAGGDERFRFTPVPERDVNNLQPRIGINYNPRTREGGVLGFLTGGDDLVIRGGYARTHDANFVNINLNIASAFPFVAAITPSPINAFASIPTTQITGLNPNAITRTIVAEDFRAPVYDQFTLEVQRELTRDLIMRVGYVGTRGRDLFQTIDGNPRLPTNVAFDPRATPGSPANPCRQTIVDPTNCTAGVRRLRANTASSDYHSLQVSFEKRLSQGVSAGVHYTWSSFIDTASEIFNPSSGEIAVAQDSYNIEADRGRSTYDRPHRFTGNFLYELPFFREQQGAVGRLLGGFQISSFFTFQSGAPFTPLNGADPTGALNGIDGLVGNAIRPNVITNLDISSMTVEELFAIRSTLFRQITPAERVGNAGRNILRADGIGNVDIGIFKNTRLGESSTLQIRADMFNATNTRNFGIPAGQINSGNFLNQWATFGGNRRIILGARLIF